MADPYPYWKFMALVQRLDQVIARAQAAKAQLFTEQGLRPEASYRFDDATETITPIEEPARG